MKQDAVTEVRQEPGAVILAGAGCGGRELMTLQVLDLIRRADVIVYDDLISQDILDIDTDAEWIYAGKRKGLHSMTQEEINGLLISLAQTHELVLRLKAGIHSCSEGEGKKCGLSGKRVSAARARRGSPAPLRYLNALTSPSRTGSTPLPSR